MQKKKTVSNAVDKPQTTNQQKRRKTYTKSPRSSL